MLIRFFHWIASKFRKEPELRYPIPHAIVNYSSHALNLGVKGERNKIITINFINRYGNLERRRKTFSESRVHNLENMKGIPVYDKTRKKVIFPVFDKILPGEVEFVTK